MRTIDIDVTHTDSGKKIKDILRDFGVSSSLLVQLKKSSGGILLNNAPARAIDRVKSGDKITVNIQNNGKMPAPLDTDIDILYEDSDLLILNKPPFMPVHESRNHIGDTLSNFAAFHLNEPTAFRAVYRLDRDTSGAVVIAKHTLAAAKLAGKVKKDYYGAVCGKIFTDGTVDAPIERCSESIIKREVSPGGSKAVTHYFVIKQYDDKTLLKFSLETGRTHQIRVHMQSIGHPLCGDSLYGSKCDEINRQALHCRDIYLTHPVTGEHMHIECDFPDDIKKLLQGGNNT